MKRASATKRDADKGNAQAKAARARARAEAARPMDLVSTRRGRPSTQLGYHAAREARRSPGTVPPGGSADFHLRYDRPTLVRQSRMFDRDNGLFQGLIRVSTDNILGTGFGLQARTANKGLNAKIEGLFRDTFAVQPEVRGLVTWRMLEQQALTETMIAGDIGAAKLSGRDKAIDGRLQVVESERIDHGNVRATDKSHRMEDGVELNRLGRPVKYFVKDYDPKSSRTRGRAKPYAAEDFVFLACRRRPSQTRGVPALTASFPDIARLDDILSSEAASWQILSRMAVSIQKEEADDLAANASKPQDNKTAESHEWAQRVSDIGMALVFHGRPGEKIEGIKHDIPGPNFETSVKVFLRMLGLPIGLPLELVLLDWSEMNYSSARAALEQAFTNFIRWQELLEESWHRPIYEWQVKRWIRQKLIPDRPDVLKHEWIKPQFPWLDQLKEAQAWGLKLDRGLVTHARALKSLNQDRGEWLIARETEIVEAMAIADRINADRKGAERVDWRVFAGLKAPKTGSNVAKKGEETPTADGGDEPDDGGSE